MKAAVVIPTDVRSDEWRARALDWVLRFWATNHRDLRVVLGSMIDEGAPWSKGAAVAAGISQLDDDVDTLILADGDSVITDPTWIPRALSEIACERARWVVPHNLVYRLHEHETARVYQSPENVPRLKQYCRAPYEGPAGGGITVIERAAYEEVGGIDERFLGWGGEDLSFGWACSTLLHPIVRLNGNLVHLWHPHPAPNLRGSEESEALVARYKSARGLPRRMREMVTLRDWTPLPPLPEPVRFRMTANRRTVRLSSDEVVLFRDGFFETDDPDIAEALRGSRLVVEETRR